MHLLDLLTATPGLAEAARELAGKVGAQRLTGVPSPSWAVVAAYLQRSQAAPLLLITPNEEAAEKCTNDLRALLEPESEAAPEVMLFPIPERAGLEEVGGDSGATQDRLAALDALHGQRPVIVVSTVNALAHPTLPPDELRHGYDSIVLKQTLERDEFVEHLAQTGYERVDQVEAPGQFAVRGGLIDFYPPVAKSGLRIELFGDEVDSIRCFDIDTQRSTEKLNEVRLTPPREVYLSVKRGREIADYLEKLLEQQLGGFKAASGEEGIELLQETTAQDIERLRQGMYFSGLERYRSLLYPDRPTLFDHLPDNSVVVWADPNRAHMQIERLINDDDAMREAAVEAGTMLDLGPSPLCHFADLRAEARRFRSVDLHVAKDVSQDEFEETGEARPAPPRALDIHLPPVFGGKLDQLMEWVRTVQRRGGVLVLSTAHSRRVREILADGDVGHVHHLDAVNEAQPSLVLIMPQRLSAGFCWGDPAAANHGVAQPFILTDAEMFGWQSVQPRLATRGRAQRKTRKFSDTSSPLAQLSDLKEGDYVVHINHGVARYDGVVRREVAGAINDYLLLQYEGMDRLYVPVQQLDRVQKYIGTEGVAPQLNHLGGNSWERTKKRVQEETAKVAKQLAELYAARERAHKEPATPDTPWQREMESAFPFEETPGQLDAIKECKGDLESDKPMDRLVCGDVGYGKTEVAVRAAFKVVQDSKQVAVLVPTTVLAQQHYQTFSERLAPYPTRIEVLSRFRTPHEQRRIVEDVRMGAVDILIGTHRLVQKDVEFRNLGLVIVDEEQRFGVLQKERLKEMRSEVDILTLSATPIPRTLHFALGGLRDLSLISDPPAGRLAVRTFVMPYRDEVVRQAIERELEREGQVYYVHNRISSIAHIAERIRKLVPHARVGIGHGQMADEELEQVMLDFMHHRTDVLLSTTIIENGLDLPNVNTLIVDRSELLGLSQMYQLRGRVGRSSRQAYAYFFSGARGKIGETAENRLSALQEFTDLGAGFKIAMRDMEIRGAGELLGVKQSGSMAAVGFEMYTDMLSEAVSRLKKQPVFKREELPEADLPVPAYLPDDYVPQESDRLALYRKMSNVATVEEAKAVQDELRDRFGPLATPAFNLIRILKIRVWLLQAKLRGIAKTESEVLFRLKPGDNFLDEDTSAVYAMLATSFDKRTLQNVVLRPREGIAIDSRVLSPSQLMRMVETIAETLGTVRGARFMAM